MLGTEILDPEHTESNLDRIDGLGLLDIRTTFATSKITHQVTVSSRGNGFLGVAYTNENMTGYEIHMGRTDFLTPVRHAFNITRRSDQPVQHSDGVVRQDGLVMGTYIHGIFDNDAYRRSILDAIRVRKGLNPINSVLNTYNRKQASYDRLAEVVRNSLNMELVYKVMGV